MAKLKMDYYVNVEPRSGSKYSGMAKDGILSAGFRRGTFYVEGDISKVLSQSDINSVFIMKDQMYQPVSVDTFLALVRSGRRS